MTPSECAWCGYGAAGVSSRAEQRLPTDNVEKGTRESVATEEKAASDRKPACTHGGVM